MPSRVISQKVAVSVVYAGAMFIAVMDQTIVNVALATIGRQFHTSATAVAGTVIGYQVSVALFIPAAGWLGDRIGPRRLLLGSIALFTVASALCGLAGSLDELVAFRVLQGPAAASMTPAGLTMLFRAFPQAERVRASAILVIPTALAPAVGPVIGGLFVTDVSWRWVFYVNVPVGVFALVFGALFLADQAHPAAGRFDVAGFVTASLGLGLLMYGVAEGPNAGLDGRADRRLHRGGRAAGRRDGDHRAAGHGAPARPAGLRRPAVPLGQHRADPDVGRLLRAAIPAVAVLPGRPALTAPCRRARRSARRRSASSSPRSSSAGGCTRRSARAGSWWPGCC